MTIKIKGKDRRLLFYDFEVFKHDWMVVVKDLESGKELSVINDKEKLMSLYLNNRNNIWIGYNSRTYDSYIFKGIIKGLNPYTISGMIINDGYKGFEVVPDAHNIQLYNFDIATGFHSLKQLEGFMGEDIRESNVPWDIDRPLTEEELKETLSYCKHDVRMTAKVFDYRKVEFDAQVGLIEAFDLPMKNFNKTKPQLSAVILEAERPEQSRGDEFNFEIASTLRLSKYEKIRNWYDDPANRCYEKEVPTVNGKKTKLVKSKQKELIYGVPHDIGYGGIHGALVQYKGEGFFVMSDIALT